MKTIGRYLMLAIALLSLTTHAAPTINTITVQGYMKKLSGTAVTDGTYTLAFGVLQNGAVIWGKQDSVVITNGLFTFDMSGAGSDLSALPAGTSMNNDFTGDTLNPALLQSSGNGGIVVRIYAVSTIDGSNPQFDVTINAVPTAFVASIAQSVQALSVTTAGIATASKTNTSAGAGDAGKLVLLDASGLINTNMLPNHSAALLTTGTIPTARIDAVNTSAGAGDSGKVVLLDAAGKMAANMLPTTAVVNGGNAFGGTATFGTTDNNSLRFVSNGANRLSVDAAGNISIGAQTTTPSFMLSLNGDAARTVGMERHSTADTAGNNLTVRAGAATTGATDKNGGDLYLYSGTSTGSGSSNMYFVTHAAGGSGTTDGTPGTAMTILGSGNVGIGTTSPSAPLHVNGAVRIGAYTLPATDGTAGYFLSTNGSGAVTWAANSVANGGTGATTFTANGALFGNGTSAIQATAAGTEHQVLRAGSGGTPAFGSVDLGQAAAITGTLPIGNGGTGATSLGTLAVLTSGAGGALSALTGSNGQLLQYQAGGAAFTTATFPATTTGNQLLYSSANNVVGGLTSANSSVLVTDSSGVPSFSTTIPAATVSPGAGNTLTLGDNTGAAQTDIRAGSGGINLTSTGTTTDAASITANSVTTADALQITANGLTTGNVLNLSSSSTAGSTSNKILNIAASGANASASVTRYGTYSDVTATGTTSTNVAGYFSASGATNNYGLLVASGNVGIGTTSPTVGGGLTIAPSARASMTPSLLTVTSPTDTTLTASAEAVDVDLNLASTRTFATGAITNQRAVRVQAPTYAFVGASTVTNASTVNISGPPTAGSNATLTNAFSLGFSGQVAQRIGMERHTTAATAGNGLTVNAGGAVLAGTDLAGGDATISAGTSTGNAGSNVSFQVSSPRGTTGSADNTPATVMTVTGAIAGGLVNAPGIPSRLRTSLFEDFTSVLSAYAATATYHVGTALFTSSGTAVTGAPIYQANAPSGAFRMATPTTTSLKGGVGFCGGNATAGNFTGNTAYQSGDVWTFDSRLAVSATSANQMVLLGMVGGGVLTYTATAAASTVPGVYFLQTNASTTVFTPTSYGASAISQGTASSISASASTYERFTIYYNAGTISFFKNGALTGTAIAPGGTANPTSIALCPMLYVQTGGTAGTARNFDLDYLSFTITRAAPGTYR